MFLIIIFFKKKKSFIQDSLKSKNKKERKGLSERFLKALIKLIRSDLKLFSMILKTLHGIPSKHPERQNRPI